MSVRRAICTTYFITPLGCGGIISLVRGTNYLPTLDVDFIKIQFKHVPREANSVAHELAKMARYYAQSTWIEDPPTSILALLLGDITSISIE
jgi:hypothetical protein